MNSPFPLHLQADADPQETAEWHEAFQSLIATQGPQRAAFMLDELCRMAATEDIPWKAPIGTPYVNTLSATRQPAFPGDLALEQKLRSEEHTSELQSLMRISYAVFCLKKKKKKTYKQHNTHAHRQEDLQH